MVWTHRNVKRFFFFGGGGDESYLLQKYRIYFSKKLLPVNCGLDCAILAEVEQLLNYVRRVRCSAVYLWS